MLLTGSHSGRRRNAVTVISRSVAPTPFPRASHGPTRARRGQRARRRRLVADARVRHRGRVQTVYEVAGGEQGLLRLAGAWHQRVLSDEVVSHAFSHGFHPQHTERLAAYWAEALGGPTRYSAAYGDETSVVQMHSGKGQHAEMDRRAIACFDQALTDVGLVEPSPLRQVLSDYFAWATTTSMSQYPRSADDVPEGLRIPRWSWSGLEETL